MNKMSYKELRDIFYAAERETPPRHVHGAIVFTEDSFTKPYSLDSRTYFVSSNNKAYQPNMGGYSIFGSAKDGSDPLVRLDYYMRAEHGGENGWKVDYCYLLGENDEEV